MNSCEGELNLYKRITATNSNIIKRPINIFNFGSFFFGLAKNINRLLFFLVSFFFFNRISPLSNFIIAKIKVLVFYKFIVYNLSGDYMKKILVIGSLNMDFVVDVPNIPKPGETVIGEKINLVPGGKGANQAYAIGKLNGNVSMIGAVGDDENGGILVHNLQSVNVNTERVEVLKGQTTGLAVIHVDQHGENCIVVIPGANSLVTKDMIDKNINAIEEADIVVMQLEIPIETIQYVCKIAKEKGKMVVLDPAPARNDLPEELFKDVDIIKPNETEIEILSGIEVKNEKDIIVGANKLLEKGVKTVIATLGGKGSILVEKEKLDHFQAIDVEVVDTTAAGDTFTAGLVIGLTEGKSLEEAIKFGHVVSSMVVMKKGAQSSIPSMAEVKEIMRL